MKLFRWSCNIILALILGLMSLAWPAQADEPVNRYDRVLHFEHLTVKEGLSSNMTSWDTWQDEQGFMWFGSDNGLNRYDGYEVLKFYHDPDKADSLADNNVLSMTGDHLKRIWVGTSGGVSLFDPRTLVQTAGQISFTNYYHDEANPNSLSHNAVWAVLEDKAQTMWFATEKGLTHFDPATQIFTRYLHEPNNSNSLNDDVTWALLEDKQGRLWVGTEKGLARFNPEQQNFTRYDLPAPPDAADEYYNSIWSLYQDPVDGNLWLPTQDGLALFNPETETFTRYDHDEADPTSIPSGSVAQVLADRQGNVWVGMYGKGLCLFKREAQNFHCFISQATDPNSLTNNYVYALLQDRTGILWVVTNGGGVNWLNPTALAFGAYRHNPTMVGQYDNSLYGLLQDQAGYLWVAPWDKGLNRVNLQTGEFTRYQYDEAKPDSLSDNDIMTLYEDSHNVLWAGSSYSGLNRFIPSDSGGTFKHYQHDEADEHSLSHDYVATIYEDHHGALWVGTYNGLNRLNKNDDTFTHYFHDDTASSLSHSEILAITEDSAQRLWVGTRQGLNLYNETTKTFNRYLTDTTILAMREVSQTMWLGTKTGLHAFDLQRFTETVYTEKDGLASNTIGAILSDAQGNLWLSGVNGLTRFDPRSQTARRFVARDGLQSNEFVTGVAFQNAQGQLIFGGQNGFNIFKPDELPTTNDISAIALTHFEILNRPVPLQTPMPLNYTDNVLSFEFALLDYLNSPANQYSYMLEGFDQTWTDPSFKRSATYTNLDGGDYIFRVRAMNGQGAWNGVGIAVPLHVTPPPWRSWWAYGLYVLVSVSSVLGFVQYRARRHARILAGRERELAQERLLVAERQKALEQEQLVAEQLRRLDRLKDEFLANTSHELRTPLNGIIGLAESLMAGATGELPEPTKDNLNMIALSGRRLNNLINDILDFSKMKNNELVLQNRPLDLYSLSNVVLTLLQTLIGAKDLELQNNLSRDIPLVEADENRVQQIMYNLLGNAVKFTPGGTVKLSARVSDGPSKLHFEAVSEQPQFLAITVSDTGIGISADSHERVFESFEQADGSTAREYGGTGLGLAVTKKLVELHGGQIWLESQVGQGSHFTFTLPLSHSTTMTNLNSQSSTTLRMSDISLKLNVNQADILADEHKITVLIVDDEPINLQVLTNHLMLEKYRVVQALSGVIALKLINEGLLPDLVLLDVMMPQMSGYEVSRTLRQKYALSELPILMLTAKAQTTDIIAGLEAGANDYITKPFDRRELLARVSTLLSLKRAVYEHDQLTAMQQEINLARKIQGSLLPPLRPNWSELDVACYTMAAREIGGDLYAYHAFPALNDYHLMASYVIVVGDVSGKGMPAALFMAVVAALFRPLVEQEFAPHEFLAELDNHLKPYTDSTHQNCALIYIEIIKTEPLVSSLPFTLRVANAGCVMPLLKCADGQVRWLEVGGMPLGTGFSKVLAYQEIELALAKGDMLILTSDGVIEAMNHSRAMFGFDRLEQTVRESQATNAEDMLEEIKQAVLDFVGEAEPHDDITIVVVQV